MSVMVVVLLAGLWALILLPSALRARSGSSLTTIDTFEQTMSRLAPAPHIPGGHVLVLERPDRAGATPYVQRPTAQPAPAAPPVRTPTTPPALRRPSPATLQRRRQVLVGLVVAVVVTTAGGFLLGGAAWVPFLLAYGALFGYLALLAHLRARRDEARATLRPLPASPPGRPSNGVLIRTARGA